MKRIIFIMVAMMLSMAASAQTTNKTLYIVDGKAISEEQFKALDNNSDTVLIPFSLHHTTRLHWGRVKATYNRFRLSTHNCNFSFR